MLSIWNKKAMQVDGQKKKEESHFQNPDLLISSTNILVHVYMN